jgi:hypothetical protein
VGSAFPASPRSAFLAWCEAHSTIFNDHAAAIGMSPAAALEFKNAHSKAVASEAARVAAKQYAKTATMTATGDVAELRRLAGDAVRTIRAFAENSANPLVVYALAEIPAPAKPTPVAPPAQPTNLGVEIVPATGELTLRWKCSNPPGSSGTSYIVRRRLSTAAPWEFVGVIGTKFFTDTTFTAGPDAVMYTVQGQRSNVPGPLSEALLVSFGRTPMGGFTAAGTSAGPVSADGAGPVKMAA